jgi:cytosine/adenosine deaminase-related metal-dependent hydrolase
MYLLKNFYILNPVDVGVEAEKKAFDFYKGSVLIKNGKIEKIYRTGEDIKPDEEAIEILDGRFHQLIFPGFIQSHIHFCQTLHRNLAEEMPLITWLEKEIWPYEAALTPKTMGQSVMMSLKEVLSSGVTSVLDMGTVHLQAVIFEIMEKVGYRYTGGKAMMDQCEDAPEGLTETTADSIKKSMALYERFHSNSKGRGRGLLHYAFAPRFVLSCSPELLREVRQLSDEHNIIIHTHASEHPEEVASIREATGYGNVAYLDKLGALNHNCVIAHMVHLDEEEKELVKKYNLSVAHCPTTNLKLGSGVAPIAEYLKNKVWVGLGSDGAPCNNSLSIFNELKLVPLLQKGINNNHLLVTSEDALRMVSINGAKITRQEQRIGKIEENMEADLVILNMDTPQTFNFEKNPSAAIVYGADTRNVFATMVQGKFLYKNGEFSKEINELDNHYNSSV